MLNLNMVIKIQFVKNFESWPILTCRLHMTCAWRGLNCNRYLWAIRWRGGSKGKSTRNRTPMVHVLYPTSLINNTFYYSNFTATLANHIYAILIPFLSSGPYPENMSYANTLGKWILHACVWFREPTIARLKLNIKSSKFHEFLWQYLDDIGFLTLYMWSVVETIQVYFLDLI